jgi:hypothetical protein
VVVIRYLYHYDGDNNFCDFEECQREKISTKIATEVIAIATEVIAIATEVMAIG